MQPMKFVALLAFPVVAIFSNCSPVAQITIDKEHYQSWSDTGKHAAVYSIKPAMLLLVTIDKYDFSIQNHPEMKPTILELSAPDNLSYRSAIPSKTSVLTLDHATLKPLDHSTAFSDFHSGMYLLMIGDMDGGKMITMYTASQRVE